jgi:hypothetical protein
MRPARTGVAVLALAAAMAAATALSACGDDDDGEGSSTPAKLAIELTDEGKGKFDLHAPPSVGAGLVEISLRVPAGAATHDAQLVKVEGNRSAAEVVAALPGPGKPIPQWLSLAGGVGQTNGGAVGRSVQNLQPGRYVILDTDEPEGDNVKSYAESGAVAALEVTGEPSTAQLPRADATLTTREYSFASHGLEAGPNRVAFRNAGKEPHHVLAFPYGKGATFDQVRTFFTQEEGEISGPPPVDFAGATRTAALEPGEEQIAELDLRRGKYALICFVTDRAGGPPHLAMGMIAEAVVR